MRAVIAVSVARREAWREARAAVWKERRLLGMGMALMLANRVAALALPVAAKLVIDDVIGAHRRARLVPLAAGAVAAIVIEGLAASRLAQVTGVGAQRIVTVLREELHAHVMRLPVSFFDAERSGALLSRVMSDTEQVRIVIASGIVPLAGGVVTAAAALGVMAWVSWPLTVAIILASSALGIGLARSYGGLSAAFRDVSRRHAGMSARLAESLAGIRVVKGCGAERWETAEFARRSRALFDAAAAGVRRVARLTAGTTMATGFAGVLLLVAGAQAIAAGAMTLGDLAMFAYLVGLLAAPLVQAAAMSGELGKAAAGMARIRELRVVPTEDDEDRELASVPRVVGAVELEDVSYAYAAGRFVLRGIDLYAVPASTVALVGASGAGKSTLCRLLLAFDRPTRGRVLIDGRDLAGLKRTEYRAHVGVVLQDAVLFDGTIAEAIRYARGDATTADVRAVAALAQCDEFIERLPNGYDTVIGERGVRLSGGQRQRVAIARALLASPRILVLDEATSSLDAESEAAVQEGLELLRRGRTTFVIAHRLSTIRSADQIVVLEGGRIVERGSHEALMARRGVYRRLYERQWRGERSRSRGRSEALVLRAAFGAAGGENGR
jgi:subfamily B ATP-binding cassette protein MsbA